MDPFWSVPPTFFWTPRTRMKAGPDPSGVANAKQKEISMTEITHIPLNKLIAWEGNARRTTSEGGISELAASIHAHGLLQSLVVKKDGKKFAVVAGHRRLTALQRLAAAKSIKGDYPVPCHITEEGKAAEVNLAENTVRENMHPADQFEAFRNVIGFEGPVAQALVGARPYRTTGEKCG